jgi:hypothetical protein
MDPSAEIKNLLGKVFDAASGGLRAELPADEYERRRYDFVFHMTDWADDLEQMAGWFKSPRRFDEEAAATFVIGFLYHVVPHLNAAGRLLLDDISDPFAEPDRKQRASKSSRSSQPLA